MARRVSEDRIADTAVSASPGLRLHKHAAGVSTAEGNRPVLTERELPARRVSPPVHLELVVVAGLVVGIIGWGGSGHAVAIPVAVVAVVSVQAAIYDARTLRIPNPLVLAGLTAVAAAAPFVALVDHRPLADVAAAIAAGWILGGAPLLFALWLVRPAGIGGGDWKLLTVQSAAVGLVAPYAAPLILLAAGIGGLVQRVIRRRRHALPLGPGLVVGYFAAIAAAVVWPELLGGPYT